MSDLGFDGNVKVSFVPTIVNKAAPTLAELNAGIELGMRLLPDGLATPSDTGEVDNSKLSSTFSTAVPGRRSFSGVMVKYVRGPVSDTVATAVEAALVYRALGYLVIRRDKVGTLAWAASDKVEVYPVQLKQPNPDSPAPDTLQAVEVGMTVTAEPKAFGDFATVAAA
jgi:uncharacterized membrane protein (DUF441 family)